MGFFIGIGDKAGKLFFSCPRCRIREIPEFLIAGLLDHLFKIDRLSVEPWARSGLEPSHGKAERLERIRESFGGRFAYSSTRKMREPDMNKSVKERSGSDDYRFPAECLTKAGGDPRNA